jgi:dTDP-4-amino-4,6-dideoxygalactose transaminase
LTELQNISGLILPTVPEFTSPCWHVFAVRHHQRDRLQEMLKQRSIGTLIHYPVPPHLSQAYSNLGYQPGDFPITEMLANTLISLPMGPHLKVEEQAAVIEALREILCR